MGNEPVEKHVFSKRGPEQEYVTPEVNEDEAVPVTPFQTIHRGQDSLDENDRVTFADFSPQILPSDAVEEVEAEPIPKGESAPEPASSLVSPSPTEQPTPAIPVPPPASRGDGKSNPAEPSKPASS